ncbi:MAG: hypothetical protein ACK2T5_17675 [Anaerolineales bacterium]
MWHRDLAHQVAQKEHAAAQNADQVQILPLVGAADLRTQLGDPILQGGGID